MTTKQRKAAVRIAKDVVEQLNAEVLLASRGLYTVIPGISNQDIGTDLRDYLKSLAKKKKPCEVCALGACFLANVRKTNNVEIAGTNYGRDEINANLGSIFSDVQMDLIESAFEVSDYRTFEEELEANFSHEELDVAIEFGKRYDDSNKRLKAIMRNIIAHDGEFVPPGIRAVQKRLAKEAKNQHEER